MLWICSGYFVHRSHNFRGWSAPELLCSDHVSGRVSAVMEQVWRLIRLDAVEEFLDQR